MSILIISHELFHFFSAKGVGAKVEEFCIGYPPRIFKKKKGDTTFSIGILPIGGFVKIQGIDTREGKHSSFFSKSIKERFIVIFSGVVANFLLAIILFSIGFSVGLPEAMEDIVPPGAKEVGISIVGIAENSPAEIAGFKIGDKIIKIREQKTKTEIKIGETEDVQDFAEDYVGEEIVIILQRGDEIIEKKVIIRTNPPKNEGRIGIVMVKTARVSYPWHTAVLKGIKNTFLLTKATFEYVLKAIKGAITREPVVGVEFAGPIGIGILVSQMIELGWIYVLQFTAILSLNLAIINILPFPALDGGRLVLLLIEKIRKRPVSPKIEDLINNIGLAILMILMMVVSFHDIRRLFQ